MHVLLIHQAFVTPAEAGGTRHYEFARYLVSKSHKFTVVGSNLSYLTGKPTPRFESNRLVPQQNPQGLKVLRAYTWPSLQRSFIGRLISLLSFMITSFWKALRVKGIDVVYGTSPPIFQACSALLVAKLKHRPFLLEIRDLWPDFAIDMGILTNPLLITMSHWLEQTLYKKADHLLVNSPAYGRYLANKGVPLEKIRCIPNGVDTTMFGPEAKGEAIRKRFGLDGKFVVTYAGALGPANDIATLLDAAQVVNKQGDIHFLIVGDGKDRESLEEKSKDLGLRNVTFAGARSKAEMPRFLAASDACIAILQNIPMFKTTYPNKVFDYMAAGRPTILAIGGVIRRVIEESRGGIFVTPGDSLALADAVQKLKRNPQAAQRMGRQARSYVMQHFERVQQAEDLANLLRSLVLHVR